MPGYSFQPQFVEPIRAGTKGGTIRAPRRIPANWGNDRHHIAQACGNHARPGDALHLWCKLRTPQAFKIGERQCVGAEPIHLNFLGHVQFPHRMMLIRESADLDAFAVFDGFEDWAGLAAFWRSTHGDKVFDGWHIRWLPLPEAIHRRYQAERIERARAADWDENQGAQV